MAAPLLLFAWFTAPAQEFQELQKKITSFTLANGMRFVVAERRAAPVIAAEVWVGAGAADDPAGGAGLARLFERLMLTGPEGVGSRDAAAERKALDAIEEVRNRIDSERARGAQADEGKLATLRLELTRASSQAAALGNPAEFPQALTGGGIGWTITAGADATIWDFVIASQRAELWFALESQALHRPSFRRFYEERDELASSWRARVESAPSAAMMMLPAEAFLAHPYRNPAQGWGSDLAELRLSDARQFFDRYWTTNNITIALAGDISAGDARRLAEKYFGVIPARPLPPPIHTREADQRGSRVANLDNTPQGLLAMGYRRPDGLDRDDLPLEVVRSLLVGRGGWLQQELVDKRIAINVQVQSNFPGARYPSLFAIMLTVAPGHTVDEAEKAVTETIGRLQEGKFEEAALERGRAQAQAALVARLGDNAGIAGALARGLGEFGDWRKVFERYELLGKVTAEQVRIAALKYLTPARRTSIHANPPPPTAAVSRGGEE
jgi:predicted Zn-dependent peptidase